MVAATAELVETRWTHESSWVWWGYLLGGSSYPLWWLLGPRGANDPWWVWWLIGALYPIAIAVARRAPRSSRLFFLPCFATAVHLHVLFALHPSVPFYALAPALNVFSSLLIFQDAVVTMAFTATVLVLSLLPLLFGNGIEVLFYAGGAASLLFLANRRLRSRTSELAQDAELRDALDEVNSRYQRERSDRLRLQQELELSQRMESVGRMAGSFAHEFNNQLMAIHIHSELLDQALPPDSPLRRELRNVSAATNEAAELAARLLAYSSEPPLREQETDLTQVLRATRMVIEHVMPKHTQVVMQLPDEACPVAVSPERVEQLLLNLVLNARDAMPEGGRLEIELARHCSDALDIGDTLQGSELVRLVISDTGNAVAPDASSLEPFDGEDAALQHGLGLSVVYAIVTDSGGLVRQRSAEGKGTRFEIYWPVYERSGTATALAAPVEPESAAAAQASMSPWRIA